MHETFRFPLPQFKLEEVAFTYFLDQKSVQQVKIVGAEVYYAEKNPEWFYLVQGCKDKETKLFLAHESNLISTDPEKLTKEFITPIKVEKDEQESL